MKNGDFVLNPSGTVCFVIAMPKRLSVFIKVNIYKTHHHQYWESKDLTPITKEVADIIRSVNNDKG